MSQSITKVLNRITMQNSKFLQHLDQRFSVNFRDDSVGSSMIDLATFDSRSIALPASVDNRRFRKEQRRHAEIFFKRIRQYARIKSFCSASKNAAKTQVRTAVSAYCACGPENDLISRIDLYAILKTPSVSTVRAQAERSLTRISISWRNFGRMSS